MLLSSTTYLVIIIVLFGNILSASRANERAGTSVRMSVFQNTGESASFQSPMVSIEGKSACNDNSDCAKLPCSGTQNPACLQKAGGTGRACGCQCQAGDPSPNCDGIATLFGSNFGMFTFEGPTTSLQSKTFFLNGASEFDGNGEEGPEVLFRTPDIKVIPKGRTTNVVLAYTVAACVNMPTDGRSAWAMHANTVDFTLNGAMTDIIVKSKSAEELLEILDGETITKLVQLFQKK